MCFDWCICCIFSYSSFFFILLWNVTIDFQSDSDSFNPTLWEEQRQQRMTVAFEFEEKKEEEDNAGKVKVTVGFLAFVLTCSCSDVVACVLWVKSNR